ncbi:MAG: C39 family peptidase [Chloroflexia bacterium]|nr:C39 family peptidase [Chloroflexia bacterium]
MAALVLLPLGVIVANAQESAPQFRYIVQPGDTLAGIAAEFVVDPAAVLAASAVQNPPELSPSEIIVIPAPGESPDVAALNASQRQGASPFVAGAHEVSAGETLASIASGYGLDPWALATFNGVADVDALVSGDRLRIPLTDTVALPAEPEVDDATAGANDVAPVEVLLHETWVPDGVGGLDAGWDETAAGPVFAADVPAYMQAYSLSCEYAAAHIATAAFGWGIPESEFLARIGASANPHWGYRGDIYGAWGGTDDYGVYPEALVPTLNEFGFVGDVFYGGDASALTSRLDAGMPVMTWLGYFGDTAWLQEDEGSYLLAPGMHVVTIYGYDETGVYVSNPGRGNYDYYLWDDFLSKWSVLDGMALGIAPM